MTCVVIEGNGLLVRVPWRGELLTVGRDESCDVCLTVRALSRRHAELEIRDGSIWVSDLGSQNGTFINGERISAATRVDDGDVIELTREVRVRFEGRAPKPGSLRTDDIATPESPPVGGHPAAHFIPGMTFGNFILEQHIKVGWFDVFRARHRRSNDSTHYALKILNEETSADPDFALRFRDEASIRELWQHPHALRFRGAGEIDGILVIREEWFPSVTARDLLEVLPKRDVTARVAVAAHVIARVAGALDALHRAHDADHIPMRAVHRWITSSSVLLGEGGAVRLGCASMVKFAAGHPTPYGVIVGKFTYMSPETVRGLDINHRSDIFALGVLLFELLTGDNPMRGETDFGTLERVRNAEFPSLASVVPAHPRLAVLQDLLTGMLARLPEDRLSSAAEVATRLRALPEFADGPAYLTSALADLGLTR